MIDLFNLKYLWKILKKLTTLSIWLSSKSSVLIWWGEVTLFWMISSLTVFMSLFLKPIIADIIAFCTLRRFEAIFVFKLRSGWMNSSLCSFMMYVEILSYEHWRSLKSSCDSFSLTFENLMIDNGRRIVTDDDRTKGFRMLRGMHKKSSWNSSILPRKVAKIRRLNELGIHCA